MNKNRILVAVEDADVRNQLTNSLTSQGLESFEEVKTAKQIYDTVGVEDGSCKLVILNEYTIDLVVLDFNFQGEGSEICRQLKAHDMNLPVLCISDTDDEEDEILAIESGADAFESTPLRTKTFCVKAKKLIEKWEAHSRLRANYSSLKKVYKTLPPMHRSKDGIIGDYKIIGAIGKGSSSVVYKCRRDDSLDFFALKILSDDIAQSPETIVGFRDEIDNLKGLDHPNVIKVLDHGIHEGFPYYVMKYVNAMSLGDIEASGRDLSNDEFFKVAKAMSGCLDYIHNNHVIHGDVKMENVLITDDWQIKLTDFGLSIQEEKKKTTMQGVMGTPLYIAPELIAGKDETSKVDIYAFGVMLFKLLTKKFPFDSNNVAEIMHHHCTKVPERVDAICPDVPKLWADLVAACLEKNPQLRPDSLTDFLEGSLVSP